MTQRFIARNANLVYTIPIEMEEREMDFKVLAVGDVVGRPGMDRIQRHLRKLRKKPRCGIKSAWTRTQNT